MMKIQRAKTELAIQYEDLKQKAKEKNLPIFLGVPEHNRPVAEWKGGWPTFLDLAAQAEARILYVEKVRFESEDADDESCVYFNLTQAHKEKERLERQNQTSIRPLNQLGRNVEVSRHESLEPALAKLTKWREHRGEIVMLRCVWFKEAVGHEWRTTSKWLEEWQIAVRQAVIEAQDESRNKRDSLTVEETLKVHECARQMAQHQRFNDAKSDAKRIFMAQQLFPNLDLPVQHKIVEMATLHYWWSIEPEESASKEQKARQLHQRGESLTNIAAALDLSAAKVKRAIQE